MTVGERLQQYRKNLGLSQEELGQRLLVSRQTVSQWETDQTMPTLDNLMRLKEVFGVSIDAILSGENTADAPDEAPLESYRFEYSEKDTKDILRYSVHPLFMRLFRMIILYAIAAFFVLMLQPINRSINAVVIFFLGILVLISVFRALAMRKAIKRSCDGMRFRTYQYDLFRDRFSVRITFDGQLVSYYLRSFEQIERISDSGMFLMVQADRASFLFRKSDLPEDSILYHLQQHKPYIKQYVPPVGTWKVVSSLLFVLSIVAQPISMVLSAYISSGAADSPVRNWWIIALFTIIPIASLVYGIVLKKKGFLYKKNIIVGIIMTIIIATMAVVVMISQYIIGNGLAPLTF